MPILGLKSLERLDTCDTRLRRVIERTIKIVPVELEFTVLCGHRGEKEQNEAFAKGNSKLQWPNSNHNLTPSMAVDIVPYPINWEDIGRFYKLATWVFKAAQYEQVPIHWGGHWTKFKDYPHWEIK